MITSGPLSILVASLIFGMAGAFVKTVDIHLTALAWFRLAAPTLFVLATEPRLFTDLFRNPNRLMLLASSLTAARILLWMTALALASLSKAVFMLYAWPIFFTILNALYLNEKVSRRAQMLLGVAFSGILIMYSGEELSANNRDLLGMGLMLVVACLNAVALTIFKGQLTQESPTKVLLYDNVIGAAVFFPFLVIHSNDLTLSQTSLTIVYAASTGVFAYLLLYRALRVVPGSTASILSYMEVVSATICGVLFFNEALTWRVAVGGALILLAAFFIRREEKKAPLEPQPSPS